MYIYLAPLQGLTDWIFREAFVRFTGGVDKTFTPFVRIQHGEFYRPAQCRDLEPVNNQYQLPVPQFLGNDSASFVAFESICNQAGYREANINLGCPYPMVTGKGMGAGLLNDPEQLARFLDEVFGPSELNISIKCRLGMNQAIEFDHIIPILNTHPITELIIHPRLGIQQYKGKPDHESFVRAAQLSKAPVCYNGDIRFVQDMDQIGNMYPELTSVMLGRGLLRDPFLALSIKGQLPDLAERKRRLELFHRTMIELCGRKYANEQQYLKRFEELWMYHSDLYPDGHKLMKMVKKSKSLMQYELVIAKAMEEYTNMQE